MNGLYNEEMVAMPFQADLYSFGHKKFISVLLHLTSIEICIGMQISRFT